MCRFYTRCIFGVLKQVKILCSKCAASKKRRNSIHCLNGEGIKNKQKKAERIVQDRFEKFFPGLFHY